MNKLDRLLNKADQFKESGKFKEALSTLSKANKLSPNDPYVYLSYAVTKGIRKVYVRIIWRKFTFRMRLHST